MYLDQHQKLQNLKHCRMLPGSWDKRFVRDLACLPSEAILSPRQAAWIDKLYHKYRKQLAKIEERYGAPFKPEPTDIEIEALSVGPSLLFDIEIESEGTS